MAALSNIVETVIDELTLEHVLVGVTGYLQDLASTQEKAVD